MSQKFAQVEEIYERETGYRPHRSTSFRWRTKGVNGVVLKTKIICGKYMTCAEWVREFIDAISEPSEKPTFEPTQESAPSARAKKASEQLKKLVGI